LLPEIRWNLEATWGVTVHNDWVCTEGATATTCGSGTGLHVSEDLIIIEPVDAGGCPVPAGLVSDKLYLTNLCNLTIPLIRYELTDQVTVLEGHCPCGSPYLRISDIQGRLEDLFDYGAGLRVHPHVFRSVLGRQPMVTDYQVRQTPAGAAISITAAAPLDTRPLVQQLRAALRELGLPDPDVTVSVVTTLDRTALGKLRRFVPKTCQRTPGTAVGGSSREG
jgi:phenylacetate-coenzyme A ligase PaaK-like adenylate-forming protein